MEEKVLIIKYGEIAMRGNNRRLFVGRLLQSIRKNLEGYGEYYVEKEQGRLILECRDGEIDFDKAIPRVLCVLGVIGVCPGVKITDQSMEALRDLSLHHFQEMFAEKIRDQRVKTFKVETKRSDKRFPLTSNEVSADIGGYILERIEGLTVDVHEPDAILYVELRNHAYVYSTMLKGFGGLPVGSSGKAVALISGGIDSPVAAFMMAKRGVEISGVYFHSPPYTGERARQKVEDLAERLSLFTGTFPLIVVPFTQVQLYLLDHVPHDKLTIFIKRAMVRIAERIADTLKAQGLVMGDSVGQVASQTMQGIHAISAACKMPILRPLAGMDKQEIVDLARKIGTFDISIRPYEDCCTIFVAKHPETKPKTSVIEKIEAGLAQLDELIEEAVKEALKEAKETLTEE